jgi:peptide/nickel transport system permease protein
MSALARPSTPEEKQPVPLTALPPSALRSTTELARMRFLRHRLALPGLLVLAVLAIGAAGAPWLAPYPPDLPDISAFREPPSPGHPFGTDQLGRDQLSRLMHGGRASLAVGVVATLVAVALGTLLGALAGYYGGWADALVMRATDFMFSIPRLLLLLLIAAFFGTGLNVVILLIGLTSWMHVARLVRASFLSLREKEFVEAARSLGASNARLIARHMLPNAMGPVIVTATLSVGAAILLESTLSYLGYGVQPPTASWGNMLQNAQSEMYAAPWLAIFPGAAIFFTIMAVNFVGDGLRDALDPQQRLG